MDNPISITAFYKFFPVEESVLSDLQKELHTFGKDHGMRGLVLIATEGINGTVCGSPDVIDQWKQLIEEKFSEMRWNDSVASDLVFPRWFVKIRPEIVALKMPGVASDSLQNHLSPEEWNEMVEKEDVVILDARNDYETEIGMFKGAIDPKIKKFQDFSEYAEKADLPKEKKILMYCTGGIRCEKARLEMVKNGYENVYQLKGGILAYLKKFPGKYFNGECFVFDHRVSVDQELNPSKEYRLCPHCGDPGNITINCMLCKKEEVICKKCSEDETNKTCSKNCRYHVMRRQLVSSM